MAIQSDIKEINSKILDREEFLTFKDAVISSHTQIKSDIKEFIVKDPEAMGIVRFLK